MMFFKKAKDDTAHLEKLIADYWRKQSPDILRQISDLFPKIPLYYSSLKPEPGPENFPYVNLKIRAKNEDQTTLIALADQALHEGFGVTINKSANTADWVFSLGDFIPLVRVGYLVPFEENTGFQLTKITEKIEVKVGPPNEDIIPAVVRSHLRTYMQKVLKIAEPKFYLMFNPKADPPWTMFFNLSKNHFRSEMEYQNALGSLSWFLPRMVFTGCIENDTNQFYII
jgi:hypothetical protein